MANINSANIPPAALVTAESGGMYFCSLLYDLYGGSTYKEVANTDLTPYVTAQQGRAADNTERLIFRVSFELHPDWKTSTNKIWQDVLEFSEATIPARYLV